MRSLRSQVLVVGAGPAGAELARQLAAAGVSVLLVDQLADLSQAAFSSAAMPFASLERFGLPAQVVASRWRGWQLLGPAQERRSWMAQAPLGVVLDFGALRQWLADQCSRFGGEVRLGLRAFDCQSQGSALRTLLRDRQGRVQEVISDWVIDASGQGRALLGAARPPLRTARADRDLVQGVGVEWLLQVPLACWQRWSDQLSFCLGSDWVAQGYGWIFPMAPGQLKVGVCRLRPDQQLLPLGRVLEQLLERLFSPAERQASVVLDRHGGLIGSSIRRRDCHGRGQLLAIGDAVSTANLLGGEGIRHALSSSRVLAPLLLGAIQSGQPFRLRRYEQVLARQLGWRWSLSGRLARRTWLGLTGPEADQRLSRLLLGLEPRGADDLAALLFDYRFERYGLRSLPYLLGWR
ncbi:MAG: NAD(P)/FAD-dependent oxidoreductase [Synechococcaceae cyanobacterium ELA263]